MNFWGCGEQWEQLGDKNIKKRTTKMYKVMAVPMLNYICENWSVNQADEWMIKWDETTFL
jgi:hypothetical protein